MSFIFVFLGFINWTHADYLTASASEFISKDITFLHETFPVLPSIGAIIEVDVYVQKRLINQSSFPLIQPSFGKLTQFAQFAKTSHAW